MKAIKILLLTLLAVIITSCHHEGEPVYIHQKVIPLNTVVAPWEKDNDLLPWKGGNHVEIINSKEEVYQTQTERFIEENPNWLNVDFSKQSIIAVRTLLTSFDYWQYTKILGFAIFNGDYDPDIRRGDYCLSLQETYSTHDSSVTDKDDSQLRIYQVAFVTEKVPATAKIFVIMSLNTTSN